MANQTLILNVSDEMKKDDERQNCVGMESGEDLCSSSSDTTEELYSSSEPDTTRKTNTADMQRIDGIVMIQDLHYLYMMEMEI